MLLSLVNDILDLKMIEQDKYDQKFESFDPTKTLEFIVAMFEPQG